MASVRETAIELPWNYARLQEFEWLVGKWQSKSDAATVDLTVPGWPARAFAEGIHGAEGRRYGISGVRIIGWDAQARQVR